MALPFDLNGWETVRKLVEESIRKDADWIVALVHWFLVYKGQMGCLGTTGAKIGPLVGHSI